MSDYRTGGEDRHAPVTEETLCAYADGWLETPRRLEVEALLAEDPVTARRVAGYRKDAEMLHRVYDPLLLEPLPAEIDALRRQLQARLRAPAAAPARPRRVVALVLASVMLALVAGAGAQRLWPAQPADALFAVLAGGSDAVARTEGGTGAILPAVATDQPSPKTDFAPDLSALGFTLTGTRVLPGDAPRTIELEYESTEGRRVSLYYTPNDTETKLGLSLTQQGPVALLFWHADGRSYVMIGEVHRDVLLKLGRSVSADLASNATLTPPAASTSDNLPSEIRSQPAPDGGAAQPSALPEQTAPRTEAPRTVPPALPSGGDVTGQDTAGKPALLKKIRGVPRQRHGSAPRDV